MKKVSCNILKIGWTIEDEWLYNFEKHEFRTLIGCTQNYNISMCVTLAWLPYVCNNMAFGFQLDFATELRKQPQIPKR